MIFNMIFNMISNFILSPNLYARHNSTVTKCLARDNININININTERERERGNSGPSIGLLQQRIKLNFSTRKTNKRQKF